MSVAAQLERRRQALKAERGAWESLWKDISTHFVPRKIPDRTAGTLRMEAIYDGAPLQFLERFAGYMHSYLTSSVNKWFQLVVRNRSLGERHDVKAWLQRAEEALYSVFNGSNWSSQMLEFYLDIGAFGTGVLYCEQDPDKVARYWTFPIHNVLPAYDHKGELSAVFRTTKMSLENVVESWPDTAPEPLKRKAVKRPDDTTDVVHAVLKRTDGVPAATAVKKPWASIYYHADTKTLLSEGGYDEMPYMVARWSTSSDEVYGRGPAAVALPDAKMLQRMSLTTIRAAEKAVDPPLVVPDDGVVGSVRLGAGAITYVRWDALKNRVGPQPIISGQRIDVGLEMIRDRRQAISAAFFLDMFLAMQDNPQMTAREVVERNEEKMGVLAPILGRLMAEMLNPLIDRTFGVAYRAGVIPPAPKVMEGRDVEVEYISPLAVAQRLHEVRGVQATLGEVAPIGQVDPQIWDNFDMDKLARRVAELYGFPLLALRSEEDVEKIRKARADAAAQQQQAAVMAQLAQAAMQGQGQGGQRGLQGLTGENQGLPFGVPAQ